MIAALRRVWTAPWLWLSLGLLQLALAVAVAAPLRAVLRAAMGPFTISGESRLLAALLELTTHNDAIVAALLSVLAGAALLAAVLAPLLSGAVVTRLAGPAPVGEQARASAIHCPAALVIGIYGLILRALLAFVAAALGTIHPTLQIVALVAALTLSALAVDLARARVVLTGARGLHPRTFVRAVATAARPRLWLRSGLMTALQWGLGLGMLLTAVHGLEQPWTPWLVRGLALVATFVALGRIAVAVEHVDGERPPP